MKTTLITGAAGFIGSFLARTLIRKGINVVGVDNFHSYYSKKAKEYNLDLIRYQAKQPLKKFTKKEVAPIHEALQKHYSKNRKNGSFVFQKADIRDKKTIGHIFDTHKIDKVVHLAAMAGVPYSINDPLLYSDVNINGTVNLLNNAAEHSLSHFVFASSSSVYGATTEVPFSETQDVNNPISPYAATKRMGEIMCYTFNHLHNLPMTCLRFFTVYGPLQRPYGMAIQKFIRLVEQGKPMTIYGDGKMARDFTYIDDIVDGIIAAVNNEPNYEIYNLGNSEPVTLNNLAQEIISSMGTGEVQYVPLPKTEVPVTYADVTKAKNDIGYNPKTSISEGIRRQIEIYNLMPKWYKDLPI